MSLRFCRRIAFVVTSVALVAGCANPCCQRVSRPEPCCTEAEIVVPVAPVVAVPAETPTKFLAVGYGSQGGYSQYTAGQQKLMAMRAAQIDAYRNLAEQVHGFRIWGNTAVSAFATQNDSVRTYVDAFIRSARVVNMTSIGDGNFEATVELVLSPDFVTCVRFAKCGAVPVATRPYIVSPPVVAPSIMYTSP
ncbi:MAG: LPP20 family lipoprotein [Zoogloeaceae bacterium]|jgi:hypothetical protein|nr:LPP20 family lipoprotein [Zoogloeaceae bacterium]